MTEPPDSIRVELWVPGISPGPLFDQLVEELGRLPVGSGIRFDLRPSGGADQLGPGGSRDRIARVVEFRRGRKVRLAWQGRTGGRKHRTSEVELAVSRAAGGTTITLRCPRWDAGSDVEDPAQLVGWFASQILGTVGRALTPEARLQWEIDRAARSPSGESARKSYADPAWHRPGFLIVLERLRLTPRDVLLEVGCGGGAFLAMALASGCRARAIDHSPDMVATARATNRASVDAGRLEVREADADDLPFPDASCTCAVSTGVFHFLDRPQRALAEIRRVLRPGGRLLLYQGTEVLRGTPAAPEPMASRLRWYTDPELREALAASGFVRVRVERPDDVPYARRAGLPPEAVEFFAAHPGGSQVAEAWCPGGSELRGTAPRRPARRSR